MKYTDIEIGMKVIVLPINFAKHEILNRFVSRWMIFRRATEENTRTDFGIALKN